MKSKLIVLSLLLITISCVRKEDIKFDDVNLLVGKWSWVSACGGLTGACAYPEPNQNVTIQFTRDSKYIEAVNDTIINEYNFMITEIVYATSTMYYLNLDSLFSWNMQLSNDELNIYRGDLVLNYKRDLMNH